MSRNTAFLSLIFFFLPFYLFAQSFVSGKSSKNNYTIKWKTSPFDRQVFIENKGQFDGVVKTNDKILFAAQVGSVWAYFTNKGIIYLYDKYPVRKSGKDDDKDDDDSPVKPKTYYLEVSWEGANPNSSIIAGEEQTYYYTYATDTQRNIQTNVFKKITYTDIYPNIDIEFKFVENKNGIEYSLILHPGADLSQVELKYSGAKRIYKNKHGDIIIKSKLGEFKDHFPVCSYLDSSSKQSGSIAVSSNIRDDIEFFKINQVYDKSKTLIIDPWVTNPNFTSGSNRVYDICYDNYGNVYAYGGAVPFQLIKFNSAGVIQWKYTATLFTYSLENYGGFAVDRKTGTSYLVRGYMPFGGAQVLKVSTLGNLITTYSGSGKMNEMWRVAYNACKDNIVVGGGGTSDTNHACMLDTNLVRMTPVPLVNTPTAYHDVSLLCIDPSGLTCYMAFSKSSNKSLDANNVFLQLPLPALIPPNYIMPDYFNLPEGYAAEYVNTGNRYKANGINGMAASPNWLYLYDGESLKQYFKNTGISNDSIAVSDTSGFWSGLDVDACDDIFLGCHDSVKCYNSSLILQGSIPMPDSVYCLALGKNNLLYVGGNGFVTAVTVPPAAKLISLTTSSPSSCGTCDGKATVTINCGTPPFHFLWNNGSTSQTDTDLCAGHYSVVVSDASCPPRIDSASVNISSKPGYTASVIDTNPGCKINAGGNSTVYPQGGTAPYTYLWNNGATTQEATGLVEGIYTCIITDNTGCKYSVFTTLTNTSPIHISAIALKDTICPGANTTLVASGASMYSWTPISGLSCNLCANPLASPTVTTTYTVIGTDSNGCSASATTAIFLGMPSSLIVSPAQSICQGNSVILNATGSAGTLDWQPGNLSGNNIIVSPTATTIYTVTLATSCGTTSATIAVTVIPFPDVKFTSSVLEGCYPLCIQFLSMTTGNIAQWNWLFGNGDSSAAKDPIYCYPTPGKYSPRLTVITKEGCSGTLEIPQMINVFSKPIANFTYSPKPATIIEPTIQFADESKDIYGIAYRWWTFGDYDSVSNLQNPAHTYRDTGTYCPQLIVMDTKGCFDTVVNCLVIEPLFALYIPSAFSPNGDGLNETFSAKGSYIRSFEMYIFDRWGMQLYHTTDINKGWDGRVHKSGDISQEDIYVYVISVIDTRGTLHNYTGKVTLLK